jgi:acid phosphatase type 7
VFEPGRFRFPRSVAALAAVVALACGAAATFVLTGTAGSASAANQPSFPIRAAFYYPWFPETWTVGGKRTHYHPTLGLYSSASGSVETAHLRALAYAGFDAAISSWHGPGHYTDVRLAAMLAKATAMHSPVKWAVYDEHEPTAQPTVLTADLTYIRDRLATSGSYLRVGRRFVVFVYNAAGSSCSTAAAWAEANRRIGNGAYVSLKVFPGYRSCRDQPASWHQYAPAEATETVKGQSESVSPGFWRADESNPRLVRDPARFQRDLRAMVASRVPWQLITTFNEWGEGTAVEAAQEWVPAGGEGAYLDLLRRAFGGATPAPAVTAPAKVKPKPQRPSPKTRTAVPVQKPVVGRSRIQIAGTPRVGASLAARVLPRPGRSAERSFRYRWYLCDWTGNACEVAGAHAAYRVPRRALGHTIRLAATRHRGAAALRAGPSSAVVPATGPPLVAAAGDIACDPTSPSFKNGAGTTMSCRELAVSNLVIAQRPTAVLTLGDTQYECGDASAFQTSFGPTWGRLKPIIHPAIGNHEYGKACHRNDPTPYFGYFGAAAGSKGWYSYDIGAWHMVALDSECSYGGGRYAVGGCGKGSPQETWLKHDLATHRNACTLAYWHEPRFSSGEHGDAVQMSTIWNDLAAAHADVVLSGHNHDYERFDPIGVTPEKQTQPVLDPAGIREFVAGTGGRNLYGFTSSPLNGEKIRSNGAFGTLVLSLQPNGYRWQFLPLPGSGPADEGSGSCH